MGAYMQSNMVPHSQDLFCIDVPLSLQRSIFFHGADANFQYYLENEIKISNNSKRFLYRL